MKERFKLRSKIAITGMLVAASLMTPAIAFAGFAPSGRATFTCNTPTDCPGANYVTFNSFTNAPNYGDERAFFDGKDATNTASGGYADSVNVHDGEELTLRVYIHNNANPNAIGVAAATAHNTRMQVLLPTSAKTSNQAAAAISADNANPGTVSDTVDFTGASAFTTVFDQSKPVQITYRPNGAGDFVTRTLPSASFSNASTLNANFGDWNGCFNYAALVTMTIKVSMPTNPPVTPTFMCNALTVTADVNRTVKISTFSTTATNGAVFKNAVINWGDNSPTLTTANPVGQTHQYANDGTFTISGVAHFTVNGQDVSAGGVQCAQQVTFTPNQPPVIVPPTTVPPTPGVTTVAAPTSLVNTGPGSTLAMFAAATIGGTLAYRRMLARRLSRQ